MFPLPITKLVADSAWQEVTAGMGYRYKYYRDMRAAPLLNIFFVKFLFMVCEIKNGVYL